MRRAWSIAWALLLAGCVNIEGYSRGEVPSTEEVQARKADLPAYVEELLAAERAEEAFYALEVHRSRRLGAQRLAQGGKQVPPVYKGKDPRLSEMLGLHGRAYWPEKSPQGPLTPAEQERYRTLCAELVAVGRAGDEAFWKELRITEKRLQAYAESANVLERPYSSIYRDAAVVASVQDVKLGLSPEEAVVEWFFGPTRACAFVVRHTGLTVVDVGARAGEVAAKVEAFRALILKVKPGWEPHARGLWDLLLAPLLPALEGVETLFLVAPGPLSNLPFQALLDPQGRCALERWRLVYEPSFSFYKSLTGRPPQKAPPKLVALGHHSLKMALKEGEKIGQLFPGSEAWLPRRGAEHFPHEAVFYRRYKEFNVFHFTTHGMLVRDVPLASCLSMYGDREYDDGRLTAAEIRTLDMTHAQVVVLSACMSAESGAIEAEGDLASLAGAFMIAGAPTVLGTLWSVSDLSSGELALGFYRRFLELGPAEALRQAQLEIRQGKVMQHHTHPNFWAAMNCYGMDR